MSALLNHVAIVSESERVTFDDVSTVAAAVSKQVSRDFGPAWGVQATVQAFARLESVPSDYWQVLLVDNDNAPGAAGYHTDSHGQPISLVQVEGNWPVTVSHETLEMLADPSGNRLISGPQPCQASSVSQTIPEFPRADILVEVCDPCEAFNYLIDGVPVSDFCLPAFYYSSNPFGSQETTFLSTHLRPLSAGDGGYLSFRNPATGQWYQIFAEHGQVVGKQIGVPLGTVSIRTAADRMARSMVRSKPARQWSCSNSPHGSAERAARTRDRVKEISSLR
jgi:hypothetical protein